MLTASCLETGCDTTTVSATISVSNVKYGEVISPKIDAQSFNLLTGQNLTISDFNFKYYKTENENETTGGVEITNETKDAGFYYLSATLKSDSALYPLAGEQTLLVPFKIDKTTLQINTTDKIIDYSTNTFDVSTMFNPSVDGIELAYSIDAGGTGEASIDGKLLTTSKCGIILVKASFAGNTNYEATSVTARLTVNKISFTFTVEINGWNEGESANAPRLVGKLGNGDVTYTYYTDENLSSLTGTENGAASDGAVPTKAGVYYVCASVSESDNYLNASSKARFSITGGIDVGYRNGENVSITFSQIGNSENIYDVSTLFVISGYSGKVNYYLVENDNVETLLDDAKFQIPAVGTYVFKLQIPASETVEEITKTVTLNVLKETPSISVRIKNWQYGDEPSSFVVDGNVYLQTYTVRFYTDAGYENEVPESERITEYDTGTLIIKINHGYAPTKVGFYYVKLILEENNKAYGTEVKTTVSITQKTIKIIWSEDNFIYNGKIQTIRAYFIDAERNEVDLAVTTNKEFKDVQEYIATATFAVADANYILPSENTKAYTIQKIKLKITINSNIVLINDRSVNLNDNIFKYVTITEGADNIISGDKPFSLSCTGTDNTTLGIFDITGSATNNNYNVQFTNNGTWTVKNKIIIKVNHKIWDGNPFVPTITTYYGSEKMIVEYDYSYGTGSLNGLWKTEVPTEPGTYVVRAKIEDDLNYNAAESEPVYFSIKKVSVDVPKNNESIFTYSGSAQTYELTPNAAIYTIRGNVKTDAGSYEVWVSLNDKQHYVWIDNGVDVGAGDRVYNFVINKMQIQKPSADNRIFKYNGNPLTYNILASEYYSVSENKTQTLPGNYQVIVHLNSTKNCSWEDGSIKDLTFNFVIKQSKLVGDDVLTVDVSGNELDREYVSVIDSSESGIEPNTKLKVLAISEYNKQQIKNLKLNLKDSLKKYDKIFGAYDVKLINGDNFVQPNGNITLRIAIPEKIIGGNFTIYHIHTDENEKVTVTKIDKYSLGNDGYITLQTDKLSSFVFVYEQTSIAKKITTFIVIDVILFISLVVQITFIALINRKSKKGSKTTKLASLLLTAPVFYIPSEVMVSNILIALCGVFAALNIAALILLIFLKKKQSKKQLQKDGKNTLIK